jgi:hypothetical protein
VEPVRIRGSSKGEKEMQVTSAECAFFAEWVGFVVSFASQIIKDLLE